LNIETIFALLAFDLHTLTNLKEAFGMTSRTGVMCEVAQGSFSGGQQKYTVPILESPDMHSSEITIKHKLFFCEIQET
jgi:hypothetical protein